ncbi:MAG: hypothetical protein PHC50_08335 [Candidatus Cloacimonetes bacterium]|nr:hypothetical protein [Candidatus Cloacimonadota bacterium]
MKKVALLLVGMQIALLSLAWAYPIYEIGGNFKGLDKSYTKTLTKKYIYQGTVSEEDYRITPKRVEPPLEPLYELYACFNPPYWRLTDEKGKTLWKTSDFDVDFDNDSEQGPNANNEYSFSYPFLQSREGILFFNSKKNCRVLKKYDGREIDLPKYLNDYYQYDYLFYDYPESPVKKILWVKHWMEDQPDARFALTVMNFDGVVENHLETDIQIREIDQFYFDLNYSRMLFEYKDMKEPQGNPGLMILSTDGTLIKHYPNYDPGNVIRFDPQAPDYTITRESTYRPHIINLRNGEIVAEIAGRKIDLCQVDSTLIALVNRNPAISLIDVLTGKLLQDFSDYNRSYEITIVRISPNGKDIWFEEKYPDKSTSIKHYRLED